MELPQATGILPGVSHKGCSQQLVVNVDFHLLAPAAACRAVRSLRPALLALGWAACCLGEMEEEGFNYSIMVREKRGLKSNGH